MKKATAYFYQDSRFDMTVAGRFLIRLVTYFTYGLLIAGGFILTLSDMNILRRLGLLIGLFLIERAYHFNKSERPLVRMSLRHANVSEYLLPEAFRAVESAVDRTSITGGDVCLHLLRQLIKRSEIKKALGRMDVNLEHLETKLSDYIQDSLKRKPTKAEMMATVNKIILTATTKAKANYEHATSARDLFSAVGEVGGPYVERLFSLFDIKPDDLTAALIFSKRPARNYVGFLAKPFHARKRIMNRAWTARPTPLLDQFSTDLTADVHASGGFLIGHEQEYDRLTSILSRPGNPNALLIGESGAGKETIISYFAFQILKDRVPKPLFDRRLVSLDIGRLVAGAQEEVIQDRVQKIVAEITRAGNIILYIPDIHNLLKTAGQGRLSAADALLPAIRGVGFSVVATTYPKEFKQYIEQNSEFSASFEPVRVQELSESEAVRFLVYSSLLLERQYKVVVSFGAVKEAVRLAHKYFRQKLLPSSAEDIIREAVASAQKSRSKHVTPLDIVATAQSKINVPLSKVSGDEAAQLLNLEATIHQTFIDQEEAVQSVARSLREYRSGLSRQGGPIASFLFVGPTGVGKTELSKILARLQFGSKEAMVRFDMSEYQDKGSLARLIGSSDGVVRGGLTDAVLEKPYCLILLDEFEKAHPDILNVFLQVLDDGRLTDNFGRTVDFTNTIVIATSNAQSVLIKEQLEQGKGMKEIAEVLKGKLTDHFKPELINRFSDIIVFKSLSPADIAKIALLNLADLASALRSAQGVEITFEESAVTAVARLGYDPVFGARPLRQVISTQLRSVLAEKILKGEIVKGGSITVRFENDQFQFEVRGV